MDALEAYALRADLKNKSLVLKSKDSPTYLLQITSSVPYLGGKRTAKMDISLLNADGFSVVMMDLDKFYTPKRRKVYILTRKVRKFQIKKLSVCYLGFDYYIIF